MYEEVAVQTIPSLEQIQTVITTMIPKAILLLPWFSAKKIGGRRMYKDARQWKIQEVEKEMDIYDIEVLSYKYPSIEIRCHVGSGTFIRSIAYHIGKELWTWWIITQLRRERVGDYSLTDPTCIKNLYDIKQKSL